MNDTAPDIRKMAQTAKATTVQMARAACTQKNQALKEIIKNLKKNKDKILRANVQDITLAKANGMNEAMLERLSLENRLEGITRDVEQVVQLPDPIGEEYESRILPNQLHLARYRTPIGVLGIIYESRPNVTIDISALAIKSGNCALLRGGSETLHTNGALVEVIQSSLQEAKLPKEAVQLIASTDRGSVKEMLQLDEYIDLIIPRGSAALQEFCRKNSIIPVIIGGVGICHLFVDETADLERSLAVIVNAKTDRPSVCNALDTLLVHASVASKVIPRVIEVLSKKNVEFRLDKAAAELVKHHSCHAAGPNDWDTEWMNLTLGIKVVADLQEAITHIQAHSRGHSDGILTEDQKNAEQFIREVDSAVVYVNASTRFTDGGQFGFGAEVAVSTQKLHARGPMGLKELTSYKWVVKGNYQVRT